MRNLKKVLSLALALVMLLGMMVVGAGAAATDSYADAASIEHVEAVDVTSALKVLQGDKGNFMPENTLTRAEAVTIITRLILGPDLADSQSANTSVFTDVAPGRYYTYAANYCYHEGIIEGNGSGMFYPDVKVTGYQFAKMLLGVLGYEATIEGYNGSGWSMSVIGDAKSAGLDTNVLMTNQPLTRDSAAQMILNTLSCDMVEYITYRNSERATPLATTSHTSYDGNDDGVVQFCEAQFPGLKKVETEQNGRGGYVWQYNLEDVSSFISTEDVIYTTAAGVNLTTFSTVKAGESVTYYYNGAEQENDAAYKASAAKRGVIMEFVDTTGNGKYEKVFATEKKVGVVTGAPIINVATSDDKVDGVSIPGVADITNSIAANVHGYAGLKAGDVILYWTMDDGQTYIDTLAPVVGTVTGKSAVGAGGYILNSSATYPVSNLTGTILTSGIEAFYGLEAALYLDDSGSIVYAASTQAPPEAQYAVIWDIVWVNETAIAGVSTNGRADALLVYPDGSTEVKTIASIDGYTAAAAGTAMSSLPYSGTNATNYYVADASKTTVEEGTSGTAVGSDTLTAGKYAAIYYSGSTTVDFENNIGKFVGIQTDGNGVTGGSWEGKFFEYTVNPNGTLALTSLTNTAVNTGAAYVTGQVSIGNTSPVAVNENTTFIVSTTVNGVQTFTSYKGIKEVPSLQSDLVGVAVVNATTSFGDYVYVTATLDNAAAGREFAYITNATAAYEIPKINNVAAYKIYNAIVDGEVTTIGVAAGTATDNITAAGLYEITRNTEGLVISVTAQSNGAADVSTANLLQRATGIEAAAAGVVKIGSKYYTYTSDTQVFRILTDGTVAVGGIGSIVADEDDKVDAVVENLSGVGAQPTTLTTVYVLQVGADSTGGVAPGVDVEQSPQGNSKYVIDISTPTAVTALVANTATAEEKTELATLEQIIAEIEKAGWTVGEGAASKAGDVWTISATKGQINQDFKWDVSSKFAANGVNITVDGVPQLVAAATTIADLNNASSTKGTAVKVVTAANVTSYETTLTGTVAEGYSYTTGYVKVEITITASQTGAWSVKVSSTSDTTGKTVTKDTTGADDLTFYARITDTITVAVSGAGANVQIAGATTNGAATDVEAGGSVTDTVNSTPENITVTLKDQ